jgi:AcrR family transcriptional regulator
MIVARRDQIIEVAGALLERNGPDGVTMRAIADELGIRAPSLYKHIADKHELEVALIAEGFIQQAEAFEKATLAGDDHPALAIADAYRSWGLGHRHLYRLMNDQPLPRDELPEGVEDRSIAYVLDAFAGDRDRARAAWAFAHGMVTLELADRFPPDIDVSAAWRIGIESIVAGMAGDRPTNGASR